MSFQRSVFPTTIRDSFKLIGAEPYDLHTILAECRGGITADEEAHIVKVLPRLVKKMRIQGELLDTDFDEFGIRNLDENQTLGATGRSLPSRINKDPLIVSKRRSVLPIHPTVINKEMERVQTRMQKQAAAKEKRIIKTNKRRNINNNTDG